MYGYTPSSESLEENSSKRQGGGREREEDAAVGDILKIEITLDLNLFSFSIDDWTELLFDGALRLPET